MCVKWCEPELSACLENVSSAAEVPQAAERCQALNNQDVLLAQEVLPDIVCMS